MLFDYAGGEISRFNLVNCWPSKISIGNLQAGSNDVLMEECVIVHEGITLA